MKERPILFSAEMVRAILDGRKTQTRRVVKLPKGGSWYNVADPANGDGWFLVDGKEGYWHVEELACPYGQPGDRLWVRETFMGPLIDEDGDYPDGYYSPEFCEYRADGGRAPEWVDVDGELRQGWKPSIHMPRWASRITLEITGVRVERLQGISRGDCMGEGCPFPNIAKVTDPRGWFAELWESINGPGSWAANPWVWVVEFERIPTG